jgi:hypothetical protein
MSGGLMIFLMIQYTAIAVAALFEGNWARCIYFVGALLISFAVLNMK